MLGTMTGSSSAARWRALALLAAIFGAGISAYLLVEYTTGQAGVCLTGSGCDEVRASRYAYPLGIPMPLFGVAFYAVAGWFAYRSLPGGTVFGYAPRLLLLGAGVAGAAFSAVLTGIEAFDIHAFCTWCLASAATSLVLLVAAVGLLRAADPEPVSGQSSRARHQRARAEESERGGLRRVGATGTGVTTVLFGGLLIIGAVGSGPSPSSSGDSLAPPSSPHLGDGPVTVVEWADFQCPGCAQVGPILSQMAAGNQMTLVYRYFPLESIHANADTSARAAEAAKLQGGFWTMADLLYAQQAAWSNLSSTAAESYFAGLAGQAGLDVTQWTADYNSQAVRDAVATDAAAARDLNLPGTPTIYIGGVVYNGDRTTAAFGAAIAAVEAQMTPTPEPSAGS